MLGEEIFNNRNTSSNLTYGVKTTSNGWAPNTRVKVNTLKDQKASAKVGASGVSVSSKGLPGISFSGAYDTSPQREINVTN